MLIGALVLLAVLTVPLTGGRFRRLAALRWRLAWLLPLVILVQLVLLETPWLGATAGAVLHVLTYLAAGVVVVANRQVRGLWLLALGGAANGLAIAVNGGTLPASPAALAAAGVEADGTFVNSGAMDGARLAWLGDMFATPSWLPLANVYSVGDVLIVAGAFWVAHAQARPERRRTEASPSVEPVQCRSSAPVPATRTTERSTSATTTTSSR